MTKWCDVRAIGLATLSFVLVGSANGEDKRAGCDFSAYRPLKIGTPIRGGHEDLAVERPTPVYPRQARLKGIGGRVIVYVLINRAGDVVRTCSMGSAPLTTSAEEAVSKWKFQKDFGFDFAKPSSATPQYAELRITFDFDPQATTEGQVRAGLSVEPSPCAQRGGSAIDENGAYVWLTSDDLMRRVIAKQGLAFPMLGRRHLRGEVKLEPAHRRGWKCSVRPRDQRASNRNLLCIDGNPRLEIQAFCPRRQKSVGAWSPHHLVRCCEMTSPAQIGTHLAV
jgi:TonB family protein